MKLLLKKVCLVIGMSLLTVCLVSVSLGTVGFAQTTTETSDDSTTETMTDEATDTTETDTEAADPEETEDTNSAAENDTENDTETDTENDIEMSEEATSENEDERVEDASTETSTETSENVATENEDIEDTSTDEMTTDEMTTDETSEEESIEPTSQEDSQEDAPLEEDSEDSSEETVMTEEAQDTQDATGNSIGNSTGNNSETMTDATDDEALKERVITIEYSGGTRKAVDFRYGPWIYSHPDAEGIIGEVGKEEKDGQEDGQEKDEDDSQLVVYAKEAELKAPEDVLIATAGNRVASFTGGVRVERKRLTAGGQELEYSEETGFGELSAQERIDITVVPKEDDGDITTITAAAATFDVDTDVSVSRGDVTLESGTQSAEAEEITFEQGLDLAVMTNSEGQVVLKRSNGDSDLVITADVVRILTETKKLMASGNVTLVDGAITTTGEIVFFDDDIDRAEVFGTPENLAKSVDSEFDVTLTGQRLEQLIDLDIVEILDETAPDIWNKADFQLSSETSIE